MNTRPYGKLRNEEIKEGHEGIKKLLFPLSVLFILLFWTVFAHLTSTGEILLFLIEACSYDLSFLYGIVRLDHLLYQEKRKGDLQRAESLSSAAVCLKNTYHAVYDGNAYCPFYSGFNGELLALIFSDYEDKMLPVKFSF